MTHPLTTAENSRQLLLNSFKAFYQNSDELHLEQIDALYTQDIEFRDPLHSILGILALKSYMKSLYANSRDIRFEYTDEQSGANWATISWVMHFRHPSLAGGRLISVRGITQIRFTDRIFYHEDFYDLGAMIYQHIPVLGRIIAFINERIGR
ncbi:MAG: nuclear transport factor 2 family protein [Pseudomonadota bacterium]